jgi:hypothetical protein
MRTSVFAAASLVVCGCSGSTTSDSPLSSQPSLTIKCAPAELRLAAGTTSTASCVVTSSLAFSGAVNFAGNNLPRGVAVSLLDAASVSVASSASVAVFVAVTASAQATAGSFSTAGIAAVTPSGKSFVAPLPIVVTAESPRVHLIYLLPSDQTADAKVASGMERAIRHLQIFYGAQMGGGQSFSIHAPVVEQLHSAQSSSWFAQDVWGRGTSETFALTGGGFFDQQNIWIIYIDVVPGPGQATGGTSSVALLSHNDVLGISGEDTQGQGLCRWVGGLGHELGHALGLPHPPGCDAGAPTCDSQVLMYLGYLAYPMTTLNADEVLQLRASPFFESGATVTETLFDCSAVPVAGQSFRR